MVNEKLRKEQKEEAIKRLEMLEGKYSLHENVLKEFKKNERIYYSESLGGNYNGILYWIDNEEEFIEEIKKTERKRNIYVYHCILKHTEYGELLLMLYVSNEKEDWEGERKDLLNGLPIIYACNLKDKMFSEFGRIELIGVNGGLDTLD